MQDSPSADELLEAVGRFLTDVAAPQLPGQAGFHARVAANALALVRRELALRAPAEARERAALEQLLGPGEGDPAGRLCAALASGELDETSPGLLEVLRAITIDQVQIDQPGYSGLQQALAASSGAAAVQAAVTAPASA
jgi:hypothetical protein